MSAALAGEGSPAPNRGRIQTLGPVVLFDVVGPIVARYLG